MSSGKASSTLRVFRSTHNNIFRNLAFEEYLQKHCLDTPTLFLWRNTPTVTIGRHQNPWVECQLNTMQKEGVNLARRYSGGGAVFQDMGCTTFTFLNRDDGSLKGSEIIDRNFGILTAALTDGLEVPAIRKGRNDIVLSSDGRKISGNAFKQLPGSYVLHHGTILVNSDMTALGRYLTPSKLKLESKGVASVHARVANLVDLDSQFTHDSVCSALEKSFLEAYSSTDEVARRTLTGDSDLDADVENDAVYKEHYEELKDWSWRFGTTPEFTHNMIGRVDGVANFDVHLDVIKGRISDCRVFTDALYPSVVGLLEEALKGTPYVGDSLRISIESQRPAAKEMAGDGGEVLVQCFADWLVSEMNKTV